MLRTLSPEEGALLREFLFESNFKQSEIRDRFSLRELPSKRLGNLPQLLYRTRERTRLSTLLRWFFLGTAVDEDTARELIPENILRILLDCGLLSLTDGQFQSPVMLAPFEDLLVASDPLAVSEAPGHADLVLWPNPTTWLLWRFTIRKPFESVLDLGTGNGIQALLAANHAKHVVATDLNARAVVFSKFNAWLNGLENIECLEGDTYGPVRDRKFDLIVSNPPFFVSPVNEDLFCDNAMELDQYCRRVIREGAERLNEGGYLQVLCEWVQVKGQNWAERIGEWVQGTGCNAWVIKGYSEEPARYAQKRIREKSAGTIDSNVFSDWMNYYLSRDVEMVHGGLIGLQRRSGNNWMRVDELGATPKTPFGTAILRGFEGRNFLEAHPEDSDLLGVKPKLVEEIRMDQSFAVEEGRWQSTSLRLVLTDGLPFSFAVQPTVAEFLAQCDGNRTLDELVESLSATVNAPSEQVRRECAGVIRRLMERGFVTV